MRRLAIVALALAMAIASCSDGMSSGGSGLNRLASNEGGVPSSDASTNVDASATTIAAVFNRTTLKTDRDDPNLINPWGLAFNEQAGPAWIANAGTGTSSVYTGTNQLALTVTVPPPAGVDKSAPTGIAFNANTGAFRGDTFIFVTEDGTVAGWQQQQQEGGASTTATVRVDNSRAQAIYKGATIAEVDGAPRLYATNFSAGRIDVFDTDYAPVQLEEGAFTDPSVPADYAPFNAEAVGNLILVTYAKQDADKKDDVKGAGNGFLDVFDTAGNFVAQLASGGTLNSPWGLAITPDEFGSIPHRLLVGNFGDGRINVFDVQLAQDGLRAVFEGQLGSDASTPLSIDGLWSLRFPTGPTFDPSHVYFTAGPRDEAGGEYGRLELAAPTEQDAGAEAEAGEGGADAGEAGADAGELDAGEAGADAGDAGELDAGEAGADAGDAGELDAGEAGADAGELDAGEAGADAGDAGEPDAGEDAGP